MYIKKDTRLGDNIDGKGPTLRRKNNTKIKRFN